MKNIILISAVILLSFFTVSCDKQDDDLSVKIDNVVYDGNDVVFNIITEGAKTLEYSMSLIDAPQNEPVSLTPIETQQVKVMDLKPDEAYIIIARASDGKEIIEDAYILETVYSKASYTKKILVSKFTATWCGYCPQMSKALERIKNDSTYDFIVMALHGGDKLATPATNELGEKFIVSAYPTAVIDYRYNSNQKIMQLNDCFEKAMENNKAVCGISINSELKDEKVCIDTSIEFGSRGNYRVCAVVLEDSIHCIQTTGSLDGKGTYNDVVRKFITSAEGDELGTVAAGATKKLSFESEIKQDWNKDNIRILVYVLKESKDKEYYVNNLNVCKAGESVEFSVEEIGNN